MSSNWESLENPIIKRTWLNGILVAIVLLLLYDDLVIAKLCEVVGFGLLVVYALQYLEGNARRDCAFYALAIGFVVIVLPFNPLYLGVSLAYPWFDPAMLSWDYMGRLLIAYGAMTLMGVVTTAITVGLQRRSLMHKIAAFKRQMQVTQKDAVVSIFHFFLKDPTPAKSVSLLLFVVAASLVEEILYRFILFNILAATGLNIAVIVVISMVVFGWAHVENGNYAYIVNSIMCGLVFSIIFIWPGGGGGLIAAFIAHLMWNSIVVVEHKIELVSQGY